MNQNKYLKRVYSLLIKEGKLEDNIVRNLQDSSFISALEKEIDGELEELTQSELIEGLENINMSLDLNYKRTLPIYRKQKKDTQRRRSKAL